IEHRFSGAGLKLLRQQFEDTDGAGLNLAAEWSTQIGAQMAYWPQLKIADFLKNGHLASYATGYDGKAFFATNHPSNPYRPNGPTFANVFTGAAAPATATAPAYPGAIDVSEAVPVDTALANLNRVYSYIASIKMPNGDMPRYLRPRAILAPPALMFRLVQLTNTKVIAQAATGGGAAAADVEASIRMLGYASPIQVDELAGYENDKTFFVVAEQAATSQLGAVVFVEREPYRINYYGPQTDAELSRKDELEWHCKGRNGVTAGHPYLLFKVRAA
ncbi:MAG TPA: Mu-like prophage major head subunit gpT family protein, partial [Anaeromyxobacteraceae bacterium]|nr:Mu-like prophage major head subunit gpT family protein [Anaeromyxobacteraceae bacterium]